MTKPVRVRAPATTANLGPGFDCAAAAFDLWNELDAHEGGEPDPRAPRRPRLRAARRSERLRLRVHRPDPARARPRLERVDHRARARRGDVRERRRARPRAAARARLPLEGHAGQPRRGARRRRLPDVGRTHRRASPSRCRARRSPSSRSRACRTAEARASLPGAGVASRRRGHRRARGAARRRDRRRAIRELFAAALHDELHEPYRAATAPALEAVRDELRPAPSARRSPARARR